MIVKLRRKTRKFRCFICGVQSEVPSDLCLPIEEK